MTSMKILAILLVSCCLCTVAEAKVGKIIRDVGVAAAGTAVGVGIAHALTNDDKKETQLQPLEPVQSLTQTPVEPGRYYCDIGGFGSQEERCAARLRNVCSGCRLGRLLSIDERVVPNLAIYEIVYPNTTEN